MGILTVFPARARAFASADMVVVRLTGRFRPWSFGFAIHDDRMGLRPLGYAVVGEAQGVEERVAVTRKRTIAEAVHPQLLRAVRQTDLSRHGASSASSECFMCFAGALEAIDIHDEVRREESAVERQAAEVDEVSD